jgi:hypothetical protein
MSIPKVEERAKRGSPKFLPDHEAAMRLQQGTRAEREAVAREQGVTASEVEEQRDRGPHQEAICFNCGGPLGKSKKYKAARVQSHKPRCCAKCAYEAREAMYALTGKKRGGRVPNQLGGKCRSGHLLTEKSTRVLKATATRRERLICIACETANRKKYLAKKAR